MTRPAEPDRGLPDRFDSGKSRFTGLGAEHIAEQTAEQPGIFLEREIFVGGVIHVGRLHSSEFAKALSDRLCWPDAEP